MNSIQMGAETIICDKIKKYKDDIKKIQCDLDFISNNLETCEPGTVQYSKYHGQQWSLNCVLESKKRMLKKWKQVAKVNGVNM